MSKRFKIVCFGGGSAVPSLLLEPLKKEFNLVGITSMVDNGGSSGAVRREFNVLPPGDIRRHLLALADLPKSEKWKEKVWDFRFERDIEISPGHFGHSFANIFLAALEVNYGFEKALDICYQFLRVKGKALPSTLDKTQLIAKTEDGTTIKGEEEIDVGTSHNRDFRIKRIYLLPEARVYNRAAEEVKTADFIIIGPGDLYSSLIPCFLPRGWKRIFSLSQAKKILICPAMTKWGETQNFSVLDFAEEIEKYIGCQLDYVLYNNFIPSKKRIETFKKKNKFLLDMVSFEKIFQDKRFIGSNLLLKEGKIEYDKEKLIKILKSLFLCRE